MRFSICKIAVVCGIILTLVSLAPVPATAEASAAGPVDQKEKQNQGKFVSYKDGTLTLKGNYGGLVWHGITEKTRVDRWDYAAGEYKPAGTAEVLGKVEPGSWIMVTAGRALIRIGARKERITGTFVSYKDERLLMLGTSLPEAFTKRYGNTLHFNKFAEGVPVFESLDGGEFKYVGNAEAVLPNVKEGTLVAVYGEGDDNNTRVELGVAEKK